MFSQPIEIRDAVISSIHIKTEDANVQTRIQVAATLDADLAEALSTPARHVLFASNGTPKQGFSSLELDTGCAAFRAIFEADPALKQSFELVSGDSTDRYTVERQSEGIFKLKLRLNFHGDPHHVIAYVQAIGSGGSRLKIVPLQKTIADETKAKAETDDEPTRAAKHHPPAEVAPKDAVRQSLMSHARKKGAKQVQ